MRTGEHEGRVYDFNSHVAIGRSAPHCLRVHYAVDAECRRLVVDHCGDHLETMKTN